MATIEEIIDYVRHTPGNTNPNVLRTLLQDVSGGGGDDGSSYELIGSAELHVEETTSGAEIKVGSVQLTQSPHVTNAIIYVKIRDKEGKRIGHFYGTDNYFYDFTVANGGAATLISQASRVIYALNGNGKFTGSGSNSGAVGNVKGGVYADSITSQNVINITAKYVARVTETIGGMYEVEVYKLKWPNNESPFDAPVVEIKPPAE